jgi:hypothetical protein
MADAGRRHDLRCWHDHGSDAPKRPGTTRTLRSYTFEKVIGVGPYREQAAPRKGEAEQGRIDV